MAEPSAVVPAGQQAGDTLHTRRLEDRYIRGLLARGEAVMEGSPVPDDIAYVASMGEDGLLTVRCRFISTS